MWKHIFFSFLTAEQVTAGANSNDECRHPLCRGSFHLRVQALRETSFKKW